MSAYEKHAIMLYCFLGSSFGMARAQYLQIYRNSFLSAKPFISTYLMICLLAIHFPNPLFLLDLILLVGKSCDAKAVPQQQVGQSLLPL